MSTKMQFVCKPQFLLIPPFPMYFPHTPYLQDFRTFCKQKSQLHNWIHSAGHTVKISWVWKSQLVSVDVLVHTGSAFMQKDCTLKAYLRKSDGR